jgi:predicted amidohydrolase
MKISAVQFKPILHNVDYNVSKAIKLISGSDSSDVYVLPELFNTGYQFNDRKELLSMAEDFSNSETINKLTQLASVKDCVIIGGIAEKFGDKIFNSAVFITPDGLLARYRKIQLFWNEKDIFDEGDMTLEPVDYKGVKFGLMVCFDWVFPEIVRTLALKGTQVVCQPANLVLTYCQKVMLARSIENRVFTVTSNRIGKETLNDITLDFTGYSQITNIKGEILVSAKKEEAVITAVIDPKDAIDKNITPKNHIFDDRREDFYFK